MKQKQGIFSVIVTLAVVGFLVAALGKLLSHQEILVTARNWRYPLLALALVTSITYRFLNAFGWSLVLRSVGGQLNSLLLTAIWIRCEACRWIPGSIWSYGSRAVVTTRAGTPAAVTGCGMMVELLLTVLSWVLIAATGFILYLPFFSRKIQVGEIPAAGLLVSVAGIALLTILVLSRRRWWPAVAKRLPGLQELAVQDLWSLRRVRSLASLCGMYVSLGLFQSLGVCLVVAATTGTQVPFLALAGINAVAWLVGFVAIFAPGGLVIREGVMAGLLSVWIPLPLAILAATLWRVVQIVSELLCLSLVVCIDWRAGRSLSLSMETRS